MAPVKYLNAVRRVLDHLETTQLPAIERAADAVIESLLSGGAVFCHQIGHGNHLDFLNRAGGLAALHEFTFSFTTESAVAESLKDRPGAAQPDIDLEKIRLALASSEVRPGDTMLVSSVSGRNRAPVELALACRAMGVKVIGFTSLQYCANVESLHPSGRKLPEAVDVLVDIGAPYGDAAVRIDGFDFDLLPVSGAAMLTSGWMIWGRVMEKMAAAGNPPTVFMSVNRKGGEDFYKKAVEEFNRRGY